ncbi:MAG: flagellar biosynthetic protein FliO [Candidatus Latescibacteria bacterium]|nr:flagellar biosynthetic protein FliO [Candidatus Latescibacterota bacterium]
MLNNLVRQVYANLFSVISATAETGDSTAFLLSDTTRSSVNLFIQTLQVIVALGVTVVLLICALWIFKRVINLRNVTGIAGSSMRVLEIRHIDPKKSIILVKVLDRVLIIGCTENSITGLGELSSDEISRLNITEHAEIKVFDAILSRITGKAGTNSPDGNIKNR